MSTASRFDLMVVELLHHELPQLPPLPGRLHLIKDEESPDTPEAVLGLGLTDAEVGALLGITRQRAYQLRHAHLRADASSTN